MTDDFLLAAPNDVVAEPVHNLNFLSWKIAYHKADGFRTYESVDLGSGVFIRHIAIYFMDDRGIAIRDLQVVIDG